MKDLRDVKKEYGYILRWVNGGSSDGNSWTYSFWLEKCDDQNERIYISDLEGNVFNQAALDYISSKTVNAFRKSFDIYNNYVKLFELMNIDKKVNE